MKRVAFGQNVYPSPTAGHGERLGRTPFKICRQCGTPNDTRKTNFGIGDGVVEIAGTNPVDREVTSGCRFCGSHQWLKSKPGGYPDASKIPADPRKGLRRVRKGR